MYYYDEDNYPVESVISKIGEKENGNIVLLEATMGSDVPTVVKETQKFLTENKNSNGKPYIAAEVGILFQTITVANPILQKPEGKPRNEDGRGGM